MTGLSVRSVNDIFLKIRHRVAEYCEAQSPYSGEIELDESYFGPRRVRGKRGRGAGSKTIVFGIFKRNGHVYTEIVPDARKKTLLSVIRGRVDLDAMVIPMVGEPMMAWLTWGMKSISEFIMAVMSLLETRDILMASNPFGLMPSTGFTPFPRTVELRVWTFFG